MPELTKDPDGPSTAAPEVEDPPPCADYGTIHEEATKVGNRSWFWAMRKDHPDLWIAPLIPAVVAVTEAVSPTAEVSMSSAYAHDADVPSGMHLTHTALVHFDASWWERILLALPGMLVAAVVATVCYALWRIEVNLAAEYGFTDKDNSWLKRSARILSWGFAAAFAAQWGVTFLLGWHHGVVAVQGNTTNEDSFLLLSLAIVINTMVRIYRHGKTAYERQRDFV